ncbi:hypothetical protein HUO13_26250 [Saccharopolyspora erythraea]|uniref:hypothetical protein n=1 Tax=Saccharopolyspora erythraea TaxID=1836 RepID=UPI001BAE1E8B|nr:hypothetical protein [Saccharopolyspora erythraea]QUH03851.1 hypothetical protein HUO13_26250 [Saccharopolyspora erythraea]
MTSGIAVLQMLCALLIPLAVALAAASTMVREAVLARRLGIAAGALAAAELALVVIVSLV